MKEYKKLNEIPPTIWTNWVHFLACGFGSGASPWAPGTMGTVIAIPFYLLFAGLSWFSFLILTIVMLVIGVWLCDVTAKDLGVHDHPSIVWDEIVGYFITMLGMPLNWKWVILGFILFRIFDIWKPWPISFLDKRVQGGLGIMLDDVVAAIFALFALHVIYFVCGGPWWS